MTDFQHLPIRVLIAGAGAIGSFYGAALHKQGVDVAVICRSEYDTVQKNGYHIESGLLGKQIFKPSQVLTSAADYQGGPPDYLILCAKVVKGTNRVAMIRDVVGPRTVIVLIANGVEIEQEMVDAFPENELISGLAFIQVSRTAPGKVQHYAYGDLTLGNYPSGLSERVSVLSALFEKSGIKVIQAEDIVTARWKKCLWNAPFNPISVLGGVFDTENMVGVPEGETLVRQAMEEMLAIAAATGHPIPAELIDQYIAGAHEAPPYKTSMALDYENNRPMEVETILGNAVRAGQREGISIPRLETLYALLKMAEYKMDRKIKTS